MDWHIIRHPETGGVGIVHEAALQIHKNLGWLRVGEVSDMDKDHVDLTQYAKAEDLDAPKPAADTKAKTSSKEN